jgi:hypothetical protein
MRGLVEPDHHLGGVPVIFVAHPVLQPDKHWLLALGRVLEDQGLLLDLPPCAVCGCAGRSPYLEPVSRDTRDILGVLPVNDKQALVGPVSRADGQVPRGWRRSLVNQVTPRLSSAAEVLAIAEDGVAPPKSIEGSAEASSARKPQPRLAVTKFSRSSRRFASTASIPAPFSEIRFPCRQKVARLPM